MISYHDSIQAKAREIEKERAERYSEQTPIQWDAIEDLFLAGAYYKIRRLMLGEKSRDKAKDDVIDCYNFMALLYRQMLKKETK